jgi:hypothetical protein
MPPEPPVVTEIAQDLFHQNGNVEPLTEVDVVERARGALLEYQSGVLAEYMPFTPQTDRVLNELAELGPTTLAIMHGSSFSGDGSRALRDYSEVLREVFGSR